MGYNPNSGKALAKIHEANLAAGLEQGDNFLTHILNRVKELETQVKELQHMCKESAPSFVKESLDKSNKKTKKEPTTEESDTE